MNSKPTKELINYTWLPERLIYITHTHTKILVKCLTSKVKGLIAELVRWS
jgi:hypothetical protein